jgi:hypothetical protein
MKLIPLTQGLFAVVDDEDYERVNMYSWYAHKDKKRGTFYASRGARKNEGKKTTIRMHNEVMGKLMPGMEIDHKSGDGLDNRRKNLRVCTHSQNTANKRKGVSNRSGFKGVSWHAGANKWESSIRRNNKEKYLGHFNCVVKAAQAYDAAAVDIFGEYACLNFPKRSLQQAAA